MKYVEKQKGDVGDTLADVSKAEAKLNWNPKIKININKGLRKYIDWIGVTNENPRKVSKSGG